MFCGAEIRLSVGQYKCDLSTSSAPCKTKHFQLRVIATTGAVQDGEKDVTKASAGGLCRPVWL